MELLFKLGRIRAHRNLDTLGIAAYAIFRSLFINYSWNCPLFVLPSLFVNRKPLVVQVHRINVIYASKALHLFRPTNEKIKRCVFVRIFEYMNYVYSLKLRSRLRGKCDYCIAVRAHWLAVVECHPCECWNEFRLKDMRFHQWWEYIANR